MNDRFHHLYIRPADFEASVAFYRDVLGWTVTGTWGGNGSSRGSVLSGGGMKVVLFEDGAAGAGDDARPKVHLDIHDIDERVKDIVDALEGRIAGRRSRRRIAPIVSGGQIRRLVLEHQPTWSQRGRPFGVLTIARYRRR